MRVRGPKEKDGATLCPKDLCLTKLSRRRAQARFHSTTTHKPPPTYHRPLENQPPALEHHPSPLEHHPPPPCSTFERCQY